MMGLQIVIMSCFQRKDYLTFALLELKLNQYKFMRNFASVCIQSNFIFQFGSTVLSYL